MNRLQHVHSYSAQYVTSSFILTASVTNLLLEAVITTVPLTDLLNNLIMWWKSTVPVASAWPSWMPETRIHTSFSQRLVLQFCSLTAPTSASYAQRWCTTSLGWDTSMTDAKQLSILEVTWVYLTNDSIHLLTVLCRVVYLQCLWLLYLTIVLWLHL